MADVRERLEGALAEQYAIERQLGAGGMATVYLARDLKHDRPVAMKVLRPELAAVLGIDRFLSEIRVTAHLQHPHILPLFDSGQAGGLIYYVMPYVEGQTLRGRLERETQLPIDEAVGLTANVAAALDYAHRHGVVHRDIKPENVLFQDHQAVVADFGIALAVSAAAGSRLTETGLSPGTGDGRPAHGRAQRHLLARRGPVRDARQRATAHRTHRPVGAREGRDGPTATATTTTGVGPTARRGRGPESAGQGAGGPVPDGGAVRRGTRAAGPRGGAAPRSEERRGGKEWRSRWSP